MRGLLRLLREDAKIRRDDTEADPAELNAAQDEFLDIRKELLRVGRVDEAAHILGRAAQAAAAAKDMPGVMKLIGKITDAERGSSASESLARLALIAGEPDVAAGLLSDATLTDSGRVLAAEIKTASGEEAQRSAGIAELDELLFSDDEAARVEAALTRALCSLDWPPAPWSERAGEILAEKNDESVVVLRARAHMAHGEFTQVEELLGPHADGAKALDTLVANAAAQGNFDLALERSRSLLRIRGSTADRVQHGALLRANGESVEALQILSDAARSSDPLLPHDRARAFREAAACAEELSRFSDMVALATDALAILPNDHRLHFARAYARYRLGRHDEALAGLDAAGVEARNVEEAELLSRILYRTGPSQEIVTRLLELSERFDRPETLEVMVFAASQRATLDDDIAEKVRSTVQSFVERFPNSKFLIRVDAPQTEEEIRAWVEEMAPDPSRGQDIAQQVRRGELPTAILAVVHSKSVAELWPALVFLPVSYGDVQLESLELDDARAAVTTAALHDPSALAVRAMLGTGVQEAVMSALPGSVISQSSLEDVDHAVEPMRDPRNASGSLTRDASGQPCFITADEAAAKRQANLQTTQISLAKELTAEPDAVPGNDDAMERALLGEDDQEIEGALRTWASTMAVAKRLGLPVLSDDRRIRAYLRADGIATFGTLSLLRALAERGDIPDTMVIDARRQLLAAGAVGLRPTGDELIAVAEQTDWEPASELYQLMSDVAWWPQEPIDAAGALVELLAACAEAHPERLPRWTAVALQAMGDAVPNVDPDQHGVVLLAVAWGWTTVARGVPVGFVSKLVDAMRSEPVQAIVSRRDLHVVALGRFAAMLDNSSTPETQLLAVVAAVSRLRLFDQMKIVRLFGFDLSLDGTGLVP